MINTNIHTINNLLINLNLFIRENFAVLIFLTASLCLPSVEHLLFFLCLSCNAGNATPGQLGSLGGLMGAAAWSAIQNRISPTAPSPAGPGIIDTARYLHRIGTAGSTEAANRAAAKNIYKILGVPGMDEAMKPLVDSLIKLGKD